LRKSRYRDNQKTKEYRTMRNNISRHRLNEHNKHEPKGKRALILRKARLHQRGFSC